MGSSQSVESNPSYTLLGGQGISNSTPKTRLIRSEARSTFHHLIFLCGERMNMFMVAEISAAGPPVKKQSLLCCCIKGRSSSSPWYGSNQQDQIFPLHEYPMLIDPVAYRMHPVFADRKMDRSTLRFVKQSGNVSLQTQETDEVMTVTPLVVFCLNTGSVDLDVSRAIEHARGGQDVFLVVVKMLGPNSDFNSTLSLSARNRRRIGACGALVFSTDSRKFQETDDNMDTLRRIRHFLLDTIVESD